MRLVGLALVVLGSLLATARKVGARIAPQTAPEPLEPPRPAPAPIVPLRNVEIAVESYAEPQERFPWEDSRADRYLDAFRAAEGRYALPPGLLSRVARQESGFDPQARSPAGALGIMQFMPATAGEYGVDPLDPLSSIDGAGRYLQWLRSQTDTWAETLAAYNWGIGNLRRKGLENAPAETRTYVQDVGGALGLV